MYLALLCIACFVILLPSMVTASGDVKPEIIDYENNDFLGVMDKFIGFQCQAKGTNLKYYWKHNDIVINSNYTLKFPSVNGSTLQPLLSNIYPEYEGNYQCFVENSIGTIFGRKNSVKFAILGKFEDGGKRTIDVDVGKPYALQCPKHALSQRVTYHWVYTRVLSRKAYHVPLPEDKNYFVASNGTLYFSVLRDVDLTLINSKGGIMCQQIANVHYWESRRETSRMIRLRKMSGSRPSLAKPEIKTFIPFRIVRIFSDRLFLECGAIGFPTPELTWYRIDPITNAKIEIKSGGTSDYVLASFNQYLRITNVTSHKAGKYRCEAVNTQGYDSADSIVKVTDYPQWKLDGEISDVEPILYSRLEWKCAAFGSPRYLWYKNGKELVSRSVDGEVLIERRNSASYLIFKNVTEANNGMYQCTASTELDTIYATGRLHTEEKKPAFSKKMGQVTLIRSRTGRILCPVFASPFPEITWKKNGQIVLKVGKDHLFNIKRLKVASNNRDLLISNVKNSDMGIYTCVAKNRKGTAEDSSNVTVRDLCMNGVWKDTLTGCSCECDRYWTSTYCTERVLWGTFGTSNRSTANKSYASYSVLTTFENLAFTIRTRSTSSIIIQFNYNSSSTLISVETDEKGYMRLRGENGRYINSQHNRNQRINDGVQHYIYMNRSAIQVDNDMYDVDVTSFLVQNVFIGGLPGSDESAHSQFLGCVRDVRLNGKQLLFFNQTAKPLNSVQLNIVAGCSGEDVCGNLSGSNPCSNGGNCSDFWNKYQCSCQSPYGGNNCELYGCEWTSPCPSNSTCVNLKDTSEYECINEATYSSPQSTAYFTTSTQLAAINSLVAQFRTQQNNTVILSSVHKSRYFVLSVQHGRVNVMHNLVESMPGDINLDVYVSDGSWHEVKIESTESQTLFKISAMRQPQFTYLNYSSVVINVPLLRRSFANLLSMAGVRIGSSSINSPDWSTSHTTLSDFLGCLREIRVGKHLLSFSGNLTLDQSMPGFSTAKSAFVIAELSNVLLGCHSNNLCANSTCKNGGECRIFGRTVACTCKADWTGQFCDSAVGRRNDGEGVDGNNNEDNLILPLIIGFVVAGGVILLLIIAVVLVCRRRRTYCPSSDDIDAQRFEMNNTALMNEQQVEEM